jgi:hypothetical protein
MKILYTYLMSLNPHCVTREVIIVTNNSYINRIQVCEFLEKIAELVPLIPITLILDNTRYQKCRIV